MTKMSPLTDDRFMLDCRGHVLDCRPGSPHGVHIMGILNVTPDSFSDGGQYTQVDEAIQHAGRMLDEGAAIIDVGGESSRPAGSVYGEGASAVSESEELERVLPVIRGIADAHPDAIISVDTYKANVAEEALRAGAHIINDITALRHDPEIAHICARMGAPLILMHSSGKPGEMPHVQESDNIVKEVIADLRRALNRAVDVGVEHVVLDPGFGFGKTTEGNLKLIAACDQFLAENRPIMVGISRKSTIGAVLGSSEAPAPISERLFGSLGATAAAVLRGATLVRTHDVGPTVDMLKVFQKTLSLQHGCDVSFSAFPPHHSK